VRLVRDRAGRVVGRRAGDGTWARYGYDTAGQLTSAEGPRGAWRWEWDAAGHLTGETGPEGDRRFGYDAAGQLTSMLGPDGATRVEWDRRGRRAAEDGPGGERRYLWDAAGRLGAVRTTASDGTTDITTLSHDAMGRLDAVDDIPIRWDPTGAVDRLCTVGDRRLVGVGSVPWAAVDPADTVSWLAGDPDGESPGFDPWGASALGATGLDHAPNTALPGELGTGYRGELDLDGLVWLRARAYDPATRSFLSPDPLPGLVGHPSGANTYSYAANDPIGHADPAGLRPLSDTDLADLRDGWTSGWWDRNGGYVVGGLAIAGGLLIMATGVGGPLGAAIIGGALLSGGFSAASQQYTTGGVNWGRVAVDAAIGGAAGGGGALVATGRVLATAGPVVRNMAGGTVESVLSGMGGRVASGENPFNVRALAMDMATGGVPGPPGNRVGAPNPDLRHVDDAAGAAAPVAGDVGTSVYRSPPIERRPDEDWAYQGSDHPEVSRGLDPANHQGGDRTAYVGSEDEVRGLARESQIHENGYVRYDMRPEFEPEFADVRHELVDPRHWEYRIPVDRIGRFNELTVDRTWIPLE
jgi:RHS repeat-associated protein